MATRRKREHKSVEIAVKAARSALPAVLAVAGAAAVAAVVWFAVRRSQPPEAAARRAESVPNEREFDGAAGPWGRLHFRRLTIAPPDEVLGAEGDWGKTRWVFGGKSRAQVSNLLRAAGVSGHDLRSLLEESAWQEGPGGTAMEPPAEAVMALDPAVRARVYALLEPNSENRQRRPRPIRSKLLEETIASSGLMPSTTAMVRRMLYAKGDWLLFADDPLVLSKLSELRERRRFIAMLATNVTYLVTLKIDASSDLTTMLNYWGFPRRRKDLTPILRSLHQLPGGAEIDLAHVIPPFGRRKIYTYPDPGRDQPLEVKNCFWSAFNFFAAAPDDRLYDAGIIKQILASEMHPVTEPTFGDVVTLENNAGEIQHAAVYLADGLAFTKNGATQFHPWMYMKVDEMVDLYSLQSLTGPLRVTYHRATPPEGATAAARSP